MQTEQNNRKRSSSVIAAGILGTFLLGSTTFLYIGNTQLKDDLKVQTEQVTTLTGIKAKLQLDLIKIDEELASYKGKNQELDNLLSSAYKDLAIRKAKIEKLLKSNASMTKFKKEAAKLKKLEKNYLNKIAKLEERLNKLSMENSALKDDNHRLQSELETLNSNYMVLERKVEIASVLKVDKVIATAEKRTKKGKFSKVSSSKKADRLVIDFDLSENKVADAGEKSVYIRVLDPSGNLLAAPASEKGYFSNPDGNVEIPYTLHKVINYSNKEIKSTVTYEIGKQDLKSGNYTLEFYCEGYFCGASKYHLK